MKTVNKDYVCDTFISRLTKINEYIEKCKMVFRDEDLYLSYSYENAIVMVYKEFEIFIERLMISCLNHDHSHFEERYGIALGPHINDDVCEFLITKGGFFDFRGYSGLVATLKDFLGNDHVLVLTIKSKYSTSIDQLCTIRNYAAHTSEQSKKAAKKAFQLKNIASAGSCLKRQNRFSKIVDNLIDLANDIKGTALY